MTLEKKDIDLLSDNPINTFSEDDFGRDKFIKSISDLIYSQSTEVNVNSLNAVKNADENMIIGIYGEWGFGKSSILNLLKYDLENRQQLKTVYFNPWMYGSEDQVIISLFNVIIENCGLENRELTEFIKWMKKYYPLVSAINSSTGKFMEGLLKTFGDDTWSSNASYCKQQIDRILSETANPLVIFIDDVDRLSKTEIQVLFKTLRLIASFKHVIYVIACDFNMVAKSIKENYADGTVEDGKSFIEKIIQIPIRIPEIKSDDLFLYASKYIKAVMQFDVNGNDLVKRIFDDYFRTPRDVKRSINAFRFTYSSIGDEMKIDELLILELIRVKIHDLFELIRIYYLATKSLDASFFYENHARDFLSRKLPSFQNQPGSLNSTDKEAKFYNHLFTELFGTGVLGLHYQTANRQNNVPYRKYIEKFSKTKDISLKNPQNLKIYFEFISNEG